MSTPASDYQIFVKGHQAAIYQDELLMMEFELERPAFVYTIAEIICEIGDAEHCPVTVVDEQVEFTENLSLVETQILGLSFDGS